MICPFMSTADKKVECENENCALFWADACAVKHIAMNTNDLRLIENITAPLYDIARKI